MKNRLILSAVLFCILTACITLVSCGNPAGGGGDYTVMYQITGPQTIADFIVYHNETNGMDQITNVPIPWEKTIHIQGRSKGISCGATIYSALDSGFTYTAKIFVNGREIASSSSSSGSISVSGVTQ